MIKKNVDENEFSQKNALKYDNFLKRKIYK